MIPTICPKCKSDDFDRTRRSLKRDVRQYRCNNCNHRWEIGIRYKTKLAIDLPKPKSLTEEDMKRIDQESTELVKAVHKDTEGLDNNFPPRFFNIRIK